MIEKIIASGRPGVGTAALDVAVKLGLAYGGWYHPDDGVPERYALAALDDAEGHHAVIEKMIRAANGTLYFTEDETTDLPLAAIRRTTLRLDQPFFIVDLAGQGGFSASRQTAMWIVENRIRILCVLGAPALTDDTANAKIANVLEATLFLAMMDTGIAAPLTSVGERPHDLQRLVEMPETVDAALAYLEGALSLKDRTTIANMAAEELVSLHASLGDYINRHFDLFAPQSVLLSDCRQRSGQRDLSGDGAVAVIIRALWERLRHTCRIRIVK